MIPESVPEAQSRIFSLIEDAGNHRLLSEWIADHPDYEAVDGDHGIDEADFDVCILDKGAFENHAEEIRARKAAAAPVLLPYLLLLPESGSGSIDMDGGELADNVVTETIDELVSLPIRQAELHWRLTALLRLREQSLTLHNRELELERQLDLFEKAEDIAHLGAWEYEIDAENHWVSDEVHRIFGSDTDSSLSLSGSFQFYHPDDRHRIEAAFDAAIEDDEPFDLELRLANGADNTPWVRVKGQPQSIDGELTRLRGTIQDISGRKERERELETIYKAVDASGHAIYITNPDESIQYVNAAFEEITGFSESEVIGENPRIMKSGLMPEGYYDELWETLHSGDVWKEEIINRRNDGETYTAMQTIAPVFDDGDIYAFVAVHDDISERKNREEALKRRTHAIDESPVGITITDPTREDNPLIYVNEAFLEMTGYSRAEVVGKNCRLLQGERTDADRVGKIRDAIDAEEQIATEIRNYRKDGTEFWNHLEIAPVHDDAGEVINFIGFQQDVSDRKDRSQQLNVLDRVLRHNLRNDMSVIQGHAEIIRSKAGGEVAESAQRITEMSLQLQGLAKKERKITKLLREEPTLERIDVTAVVQRVAAAASTEHPDATITVDVAEDVSITATKRLEQAVGELVTNAVVHDDGPEPEVTVSVVDIDGVVRIEIADTGPPIPEMDRNIFTTDEEETSLSHGGGLGLWLVKLITTRSGGSISIGENAPTGNVVKIEFSE